MKITKKLPRKNFAAAVVKQLEGRGISCVLVGDLDFISPHLHEDIEAALAEIGFKRDGRYFVHPNSEFYVEFPSGPVAIGNEVPVKPAGRLKIKNTVVKMLSPTQCVMDRLAAWFHWNDRRSLIHAIWVCERHPVNLAKIKRWAEREGQPIKYAQFLEQLKFAKKTKP